MVERNRSERLASPVHGNRILTLSYELLIEDVKHLEE